MRFGKAPFKVITGSDPGNPFLQGLILPVSAADIVAAIARDPFRSDSWRARHRDPSMLDDYLEMVVAPTHPAIDIARAFFSAVMRTYERRDMRSAEYRRRYYAARADEGNLLVRLQMNGIIILGITGSGKTHLIDAALMAVPQVIKRHRSIPTLELLLQIVWIKVDMTDVANLEALAMEMAKALDKALGGGDKIYNAVTQRGRSVGAKFSDVMRHMETYGVALIVFDEIKQTNFSGDKAARIREAMLKLCNSGFSVALAGNPLGFWTDLEDADLIVDASSKISTQLPSQVARRLTAGGKIRLDPAEDITDPDWRILVDTIWPCQLVPDVAPLSPDIDRLLHVASGGIPAFLKAVFSAAQQLALNRGHTAMALNDIQDAADKLPLLRSMAPLIRAFNTKDPVLLRQVADVDQAYYDRRWRRQSTASPSHVAPIAGLVEVPQTPDGAEQEAILRKLSAATRGGLTRSANRSARSPSAVIRDMVPYHLDQLDQIIDAGENDKKSKEKATE